MKIIGLTGGIASGKSYVAKILESCGAVIIDADLLAREVVAPGEPALATIREIFGDGVLMEDGSLDRKALGSIVFSDAAARKLLEEITHPAIAEKAEKSFDRERTLGRQSVFYMVPLLIEAGIAPKVDEIWVVAVDRETQIARLMKRDCIEWDEAERKMAAQMPLEEKSAYADVIIDNNGTPEETASRVRKEWDLLRRRLAADSC
jgi:dephospho-CoA kinase